MKEIYISTWFYLFFQQTFEQLLSLTGIALNHAKKKGEKKEKKMCMLFFLLV